MSALAADARPDVTSPVSGRVKARGTGPFYLVALAATAVSIDTSWRFFGDRLHITNPLERSAMFAVLEMALVACGYAMAQNVRQPGGRPGPARMFAWALCGLSAYMAVDLAGPVEGVARVVLGPVLALIALHLALGIEIRSHRGARPGMWARIGVEIRERLLSRFSLGDDQRLAAERSRDRARERAARIATAPKRWWAVRRIPRLARAVHASGATVDAAQRAILVGQVATLKHLDDLVTSDVPSPWRDVVPPHVQRLTEAAQRSAEALREAAECDAALLRQEATDRSAAVLREAAEASEAKHIAAQHVLDEAQHEVDLLRARIEREDRDAAARREALHAEAQQAYAQLMTTAQAAQARADRLLVAAAEATHDAAAQHPDTAPKRSITRRDTASAAAPDADLVAALHREFKADVPSLRDAAKHLRERFGSCSDKRVAAAVAALRAKRNGHQPTDPERLQLTSINGHNLVGVTP